MVDVFEEVDEQLRSEQFKSTILRYLPWVGAGLLAGLLVAVAIWGYRQYVQKGQDTASEAYAAGVEAMNAGDRDKAFGDFQTAAKSSSPGYRTLALMQDGGIRIYQKRFGEAVGLFDQAAAGAPNLILGDAARLKAAYVLLDEASYADVESRMKPLTDTKRPYAPLARELIAMAKLGEGRLSEARSDFVVLSLLAAAPDDVRSRAHAAMTLIDDGVAANLPAIAKASLSLPTPAPQSAGPDTDAQQAAQGDAAQ